MITPLMTGLFPFFLRVILFLSKPKEIDSSFHSFPFSSDSFIVPWPSNLIFVPSHYEAEVSSTQINLLIPSKPHYRLSPSAVLRSRGFPLFLIEFVPSLQPSFSILSKPARPHFKRPNTESTERIDPTPNSLCSPSPLAKNKSLASPFSLPLLRTNPSPCSLSGV